MKFIDLSFKGSKINEEIKILGCRLNFDVLKNRVVAYYLNLKFAIK